MNQEFFVSGTEIKNILFMVLCASNFLEEKTAI